MTNTSELSHQTTVFNVCNGLYSDGIKPTVRKVLEKIPDISSTSTVHKYLKAWKEEQEANQKSLHEKLGFSQDFISSFHKEISRFTIQAEQKFREKMEEANDQRDQAIDDLEVIENRFDKQSALITAKDQKIKELELQLAQSKEKYETIESELRSQVKNLTDENKALIDTSEKLRTELAKNELINENAKMLEKENKALNRQVLELTSHKSSLEATVLSNNEMISYLKDSINTKK